MKKAFAECRTSLPSDRVEEDGEIVVSGGRAAADAIREILAKAGYEASAPEHMGDHGWDMDVRVDGKRIWIEVQMDSDEFFLQVEAMVGFWDRLRGPDLAYYEAFLTKLNDGLRSDKRFTQIHWFKLERHSPVGDPLADPLKTIA